MTAAPKQRGQYFLPGKYRGKGQGKTLDSRAWSIVDYSVVGHEKHRTISPLRHVTPYKALARLDYALVLNDDQRGDERTVKANITTNRRRFFYYDTLQHKIQRCSKRGRRHSTRRTANTSRSESKSNTRTGRTQTHLDIIFLLPSCNTKRRNTTSNTSFLAVSHNTGGGAATRSSEEQ